jgi:hypothetical protein
VGSYDVNGSTAAGGTEAVTGSTAAAGTGDTGASGTGATSTSNPPGFVGHYIIKT